MANVAGEEHVFRKESLQGTTTVTFRSRRYHLPSVIVNQPHQIDPKAQGPHEECLLLNMGLFCPHCASKAQLSSKDQRVAVTRDSQGNLVTQPISSHPSGQHQTFHSLPYDRVQQHLQEQQRLQAEQGALPQQQDNMGHHQPSQTYGPDLYSGHYAGKPSHYLHELRYNPPVRTHSLPSRYLPLEYGFIEQHEGTFSYEDHKRKPHQRSRLKELHTDSLKLQKRRQKLKLADMGIHGESAIPEMQSPTTSHTDSKPGSPDESVVPVPIVGFENPNFDYAAAENNRRYHEQQRKQIQLKEGLRNSAVTQQQHFHQQQAQAATQQAQQLQKNKQGKVFVNNYALDYEKPEQTSSPQRLPAHQASGQQRFFDDVKQQQQYWKQQEEMMLHKENLKHQELYRKQQEILYRKQQEKLIRQQQQHRKAQEQQYRRQLEKQQVEPQRYNNLGKQQTKEEAMRQHQEQLREAEYLRMQKQMMQQEEQLKQHQHARHHQQQHQHRHHHQQQHQQYPMESQESIPFHAPETFDDIVGERHVHHHYSYHNQQETTGEKNIQVDNLPREFFQQHKTRHNESGKREREHRHRDKHGKKRHKRHKNNEMDVNKEKRHSIASSEIKEPDLFISEPADTDNVEAKENNIANEQIQAEAEEINIAQETEQTEIKENNIAEEQIQAENHYTIEEEENKTEKLRREHKQNTAYYRERNTTQEQPFVRYTSARMLYDRCVKEMKGLHATESLDFVQDQTRIVSKIRRDSCLSDTSSTAPAQSETSEASTGDLQQTKGGTFFAHVQHRGSVDSAEPVESPPPAGLEQGSRESAMRSIESHSDTTSPELFPAKFKYDSANQQHILSISAEAGINDDALSGSPPASFEEIDNSLQKYMEWLQTEEDRQKHLATGTRKVQDKLEDKVVESTNNIESKTDLNIPLHIEEPESKRSSYLEPQEDVVEVEKWDSNGTTYSVYIVTKKVNKDNKSAEDIVDINSEVIAMLDQSMESEEQLDSEPQDDEEQHKSSSSLNIPTIKEPSGKENDVRFYISSSNEFLEDAETRSTGSYRISEEELLDLEYRTPTILDENENALFHSELDTIKESTGSFMQVPPSAMNLESSDADDGDMQIDESAEEKEFEKIMSAEEMYDSTSDEEFSQDPSFDIEEEVDDILENIEVETYSPTSTLSKAFSHPRRKKKPRMLRHVQPPEMVPIPSAESNSEMTSSTSSNQEMLQSLNIQTTHYQHLANECATSTDEDAEKAENGSKDNEDVNVKQESEKGIEEDTEEEEVVLPGTSPEDAFEVVVEAASEEGYGSDWPSDHDEFLPRVIKGKGKKSSDMFIYDFYHEKLSQKRTSSCEVLADGASVGRISDIGSDDLEKSVSEEMPVTQDAKDNNEQNAQENTLGVPSTGEQVMTSSMTSSNISDGSSLEQIIDDTMQLTERILSSCETIDRKSQEKTELLETKETEKPTEEMGEGEKQAKEDVKETTEKDLLDPKPHLTVTISDDEIKELERDTKDLEEISRWSQENINKAGVDEDENDDVDKDQDEYVPDEVVEKQNTITEETDSDKGNSTVDTSEDTAEWSQDTVRKSSMDSLDTAEIIHVIDDIPEDDIYDTNEEEKIANDERKEQHNEKSKIPVRSQNPNESDAEVVLDTHVTIVEENFYESSVDKLEEETRCLTTKSTDHKDMFMESESKACMLDEPLYTNRQLLLPRSPLVTKDNCSEDENFADVSGSDFDTKSSDFDTKSFEELERLIAMEDSCDEVEKDKTSNKDLIAESRNEPPQLNALAKVVVKEVETLEGAMVSKVTYEEHTTDKTKPDIDKPRRPQKITLLAKAAEKIEETTEDRSREVHERGAVPSTNDEYDSALKDDNEGIEPKDVVRIKKDISRHPLVVRRQQGLLNRDTEFESVTSDAVSDTNDEVVYNSTPSDSVVDESDSSSISLADKPKMDLLKPGMHTFNDDSSISDIFPDTDSEPLDDEVFLSDSCYPKPEKRPQQGIKHQTSWSELVTDKSSNVASFEAPSLLSDTQAEDFLRHMLGIHDQACHSDASDSEQAELQEDLSACLSDVCQVVTSESESEAGEVLSEEVHTQEVTLVFAWPKDKKTPFPSPSRTQAGKPYREIHVRKVTRLKDFDVEILEGPKITYTKKKAIEDKDSRTQENPEIMVSKPEEDSDKLDVTCESGIFSSHDDELRQETLSGNLNLDDLLQNLSDISSELDMTGEKSVQMHDRNEAWNIHAIPLVIPRTVGTSGRSSVSSETGMKEAMRHSGGDALVESREAVHEADVEHDHSSDKAAKHEDLAQHGGEKSEVDSTAVDGDHKTFCENKDNKDEHELLSSKNNIDTKQIEGEHESLEHTGDKKTHARRTIIVTAVLRPKSELEKQFDRPKDVCPVKHCDTCKSLVHVRKVAIKGKSVRSHLKCMKCSQMINERLVHRVTKTSSCKNISESSNAVYSTNTWPPRRDRKDHDTTDTSTEHFKKLGRMFCELVAKTRTSTKTDKNTSDTQVEQSDKLSNQSTTNHLITKEHSSSSSCVAEYTPLFSDSQLLCEIEAQLRESHLSVDSTESYTNPFDDTSSSTDTIVGPTESTNIVTFQNPHPHPHGLRSPPPGTEANSPSKPESVRSGSSLSKDESIDSDNLDVIVEGYGSDTEELLSEIEYELHLQVPVPVLFDKVEDSSRYVNFIAETPRAEGLENSVCKESTFYQISVYRPQEILYLNYPDNYTPLVPIDDTMITEAVRSKVPVLELESPKVLSVDIKHRSAGFDTRELVLSVENTTLTFEPYEEEMIELPKDIDIIYPTVTTEGVLPTNGGKEIQQHSRNGIKDADVCGYADIVTENILKDTLKQLALPYPPIKKRRKNSPLKYALDIEIEPMELQNSTQLESTPDLPEYYLNIPTQYINIQLQLTTAVLEDPILTNPESDLDMEVSSQFLYEASQYWFEIGVEFAQLGVVTNPVPEPPDATECRWQKRCEQQAMPSPMTQLLILEDYFMSEYQAAESEISKDAPLLLSSTNVKIDTIEVTFSAEPAGNQDHKTEKDENVTQEKVEYFEESNKDGKADKKELVAANIASMEKRSSSNEIEFKAKTAAIKEAIQAVHGSKEKLNQLATDSKHKQGSILVNTRSHKSMHIKQMVAGLVETAFHEAKSELKVMFHEQPNTTEKQVHIEQDEHETNPEISSPEKEHIEWKTNRKKSEENKIWKGNPFIETDENKVWKGNPVHYDDETQVRVIPVLQRRTTVPVQQSEIVTPRETANNVSVVDIGEVRTAGSDDRALKSDAIAGARLVWMDYRGSNRYYSGQHNVPDYQETVDKVMYPRMSQSTPELHTAEEIATLEEIKKDIIKIDKHGRFVLPAAMKVEEKEIPKEEPKKKKELSIRIPVTVVKDPTRATAEDMGTVSERRLQQQEAEKGVVAKVKDGKDSKLPDLLGGAPAFTQYGGVRTFNFGKDDIEKDVHDHEEFSKDGEHVKESKLTTTTQHSGKHSECTFSTEGTISDIPVFGVLFGGVEDGSRPTPDHKSIQSAFDSLFGTTGQTDHTRLKQIESDGTKLDWHKMQEERANIERITYRDDEANTQTAKTLDFKVERAEETIGEVPADLGIIAASKPIHDVSHEIARKDVMKSRRGITHASDQSITYERPDLPPLPLQTIAVHSPSPKSRRRKEVTSPRSPKSPRRRRRPVCPEHQRVFQDFYEVNQEMRPRIEVVRETEPPAETYIHRDEIRTETKIEMEPSSQTCIPQETVQSVPIPVQHEKVRTTATEYEKISVPAEIKEVAHVKHERKHFDDSREKHRSAVAVASDEDIEVRNIMEKSPSREKEVVTKKQTRKKVVQSSKTRVKETKTIDTGVTLEAKWKGRIPDDISSTHYVFPAETKYDIVEHAKPSIHMTCDENVEDSEEDYNREVPENQRTSIEVSKKYFKTGTSAAATQIDVDDEEIPEGKVFYDDVAGARLILKDRFGPSAFEVVRPQSSRRMVASTHDVSWSRPKDEKKSHTTLSTSSPSLYKSKEYTSESKTREEMSSFSESMMKQKGTRGGVSDISFQGMIPPPTVPSHQAGRDDRKSEDYAYTRRSDQPADSHDNTKTFGASCRVEETKEDVIKVDSKGRFVLPASMISNVSKVTRPTKMKELPVAQKPYMSGSSPVLHKTTEHTVTSNYDERRKSSSPVGLLRPSDIYDRDTDILHHGMSVSPSSPSFYRRNNQVTVRHTGETGEETSTKYSGLLKPSDAYSNDTEERSLSTSSPSLYTRKDDYGVGRGLIKPKEIKEMEQRIGMRQVSSSSEGQLSIPIGRSEYDDVTQSCKELGSIQTRPTGISFLDAMFAHRSSTTSVDSSASSSWGEQHRGRHREVDVSDEDQTAPVHGHGYSRSVDSVVYQGTHRQPVQAPTTQPRSVPIGSFIAESEPNISGWIKPFSPRKRKLIEYVVQKQFLDETVPYILGSDVIREDETSDEEQVDSTTAYTETRRSYQSQQQGTTTRTSTKTSGKQPTKYVLHCRSFYDNKEPFISSEDVSLSVNDTDEIKMKKNLRVIKKKLPKPICDGNDDTHEIEERDRTISKEGLEQKLQNYKEEKERQAIYIRKLTKDDAYQYSLPKRNDNFAKLSQSEQHLTTEGQQMHHELDKEIRDLIGLSLPSLNQLLTKQRIVKCKVEAVEIPEDRARVISFSDVRRKHSPIDGSLKRYTRTKRPRAVTEYIIQRDNSPNGLRSSDVIQKPPSRRDHGSVHQIARHTPDNFEEITVTCDKYINTAVTENDPDKHLLPQRDESHYAHRPKHPFHITNYEKRTVEKPSMGVNVQKQCAPPSNYELLAQPPATREIQFPVLSSPPIRRKEIKVRVNETKFTMPNSQADVSRIIQYEQELNDSDEEAKSDTTKTVVTSTGSTGTASEPYPGVLPRAYLAGSQVAISESSSETSERDWDAFFKSLDAQNAQLYEVEGSNSDVSEDLDMILYSGGYLNQGLAPLPGKPDDKKFDASLGQRTESVEARRQCLTRQGAVDHSSPVSEVQHFSFDTKFPTSSVPEYHDSFDKLFKKVEEERYDNVPITYDVEEYDNVPSTQVKPLQTSSDGEDIVKESREVWNLRAMLAGQDRPAVLHKRAEPQSRYPESVSVRYSGERKEIQHAKQTTEYQGLLPDKMKQMERLNTIRGNVEELLSEVETLQSAIRASQERRASSVVSDFPSHKRNLGSMEELRSARSKSWDSNVEDLNATERLLQDIVAQVKTVDNASSSHVKSQARSFSQSHYTHPAREQPDSVPSSDASSESDTQEHFKREKTPKSILKVKTEKPMSHSGIVRFSEDQVNNIKQPPKPRKKQVSTLAARTSPAGRSPPTVQRIILDDTETHL